MPKKKTINTKPITATQEIKNEVQRLADIGKKHQKNLYKMTVQIRDAATKEEQKKLKNDPTHDPKSIAASNDIAKEFNTSGKLYQTILQAIGDAGLDFSAFNREAIKKGEKGFNDQFKILQNRVREITLANSTKADITRKAQNIFYQAQREGVAKYQNITWTQLYTAKSKGRVKLREELFKKAEAALQQQKVLLDSALQEFSVYIANGELEKFHLDNVAAYLEGDAEITLARVDKAIGEEKKLSPETYIKYGHSKIPIQLKVGAGASFKLDYKIGGVSAKRFQEIKERNIYGNHQAIERLAIALATFKKFKDDLKPQEHIKDTVNPRTFLEAYQEVSASEYYVFGFSGISYIPSKGYESVSGSGYWSVSVPKEQLLNFYDLNPGAFYMDQASRDEGDKLRFDTDAFSSIESLFGNYGPRPGGKGFPIHYQSDYLFYAARRSFAGKGEGGNYYIEQVYNPKTKDQDDFIIVHEAIFGGLLNPAQYWSNTESYV